MQVQHHYHDDRLAHENWTFSYQEVLDALLAVAKVKGKGQQLTGEPHLAVLEPPGKHIVLRDGTKFTDLTFQITAYNAPEQD